MAIVYDRLMNWRFPPVRQLSITHNFCSDSGPQRDVGQPR
jgi:hypothetical protein